MQAYKDNIEGKFSSEISKECKGAARINYIFHEIFAKVINDVNPFEYL